MEHLLKKLTAIPSRIPIVKEKSRSEPLTSSTSRSLPRLEDGDAAGKLAFRLENRISWQGACKPGLDRIVETKRRSESCRGRISPRRPLVRVTGRTVQTRELIYNGCLLENLRHTGGGRGSARGCFSI